MRQRSLPIITLTTDFGTRDAYVGSMKAVILSINPRVTLVDLSHEIGPQDVREAAFLVDCSYRYFPRGTIHLVVVDPGVGSERRILCAKTEYAYFLAPDNGVLTPVLQKCSSLVLHEVTNPAFFRKDISATFHGRDKFAPSAAHLAKGDIFRRMGPVVTRYRRIPWAAPELRQDRITGQILHVDRFGNLITNIQRSHLEEHKRPPRKIRMGQVRIRRWANYYAQGREGELVALVNSADYVEIAMRQESAALKTRARVGTPVVLSWK